MKVLLMLPMIVGLCACAGGRVAPAPVTNALPPLESEWSLSEVVEKGTTGLEFATADDRSRAMAEAQAPELKTVSARTRPPGTPRSRLNALVRAAKKGDLAALSKATESELLSAVKSAGPYPGLKKLVGHVLAQPPCATPALAFGLAGKAEEEFPDRERIDDAIALYGKAAGCATGDILSRSQYRLSLLLISRNDCAGAVPLLTAISFRLEARDYHSRALYWRSRCAEQSGDPAVAANDDAKERLLKEFPLSYHAILLQGRLPETLRTWAEKEDSRVLLRSKWAPDLNPALERMEAWLSMGQASRIAKTAAAILPRLAEAEPQLQLYYCVLLHRSNNYAAKFRLLAPLFRQHPQLVSKAGLKLLYPNRDYVSEFAKKSDPLLLLSLIRQESAFNETARSRVGALGLMQLMPMTGRRVAGLKARELLEPVKNVNAGSRYLDILLKRFDGDVELALAAYNAGPLAVDRWVKRYQVDDRVLFLDLIPYKETREYVASIARNFVWYNMLYRNDQEEARFKSLQLRKRT